uniref:Uncharacterized protein n=1 Tax=Arundo donax TaxID=35708 RepID=A0A0A9DUD0_ARUDO
MWTSGAETFRRQYYVFFTHFLFCDLHATLITYMRLQTCFECGKDMERCPLCQQHITTRIRLY